MRQLTLWVAGVALMVPAMAAAADAP